MHATEDRTSRTLKNLILTVSLLLALFVGSSFVGTATQLAAAADRFYDGAGQWVFYAIVGLMGVLLLYAITLYFRFPPALIPPNVTSGPAFALYQHRLLDHLNRMRRSRGQVALTADEVPSELDRLAAESHKVIRETASSVFVSTAVMQSGRLDGLIVLGTQLRLVWQIAKIYQLRPSPRQMAYLYGNVSANAIAAQSLDDIDFAELSTPIVTAVIPSLKGAIPGLQGLASLLANSLSSGAANAMLTLRIGSIAQQYCALRPGTDISSIRPSASRFAVAQIGTIVKEQGSAVVSAAFDAIAGPVADAVGKTKDAVQQAITNVSDGVGQLGNRTVETAKGAVQGVKSAVELGGEAVSSIAMKVKDGSAPVASATVQALGSTTNSMKNAAVSVAVGVKDGTTTGAARVGELLGSAGQQAMKIGGQATEASVNLTKGIIDSTGAGMKTVKDRIFHTKPEGDPSNKLTGPESENS